MPVLAAMDIVLQLLFVMHAIRTGRDRYWIWIIIFFPGIGCIIYFLCECAPEILVNVRQNRNRKRQQSIEYLEDQLAHSPSVINRKKLAEAYVNSGRFDEAIALYLKSLDGIYSDDPAILEGLSCAYFFKGDYENAKIHLHKWREIQTSRGNTQFDLLLARAYEESGELDRALQSYATLSKTYPGEEVRCRQGLLLKKLGRRDEADQVFQTILQSEKVAPAHYLKAQQNWIKIARSEMTFQKSNTGRNGTAG